MFETEPLPAESALWSMPNVLITPHSADDIHGWPCRFAALFADNLERWAGGGAVAERGHAVSAAANTRFVMSEWHGRPIAGRIPASPALTSSG